MVKDFLIGIYPYILSYQKELYQLIHTKMLGDLPLTKLSMLLKTMHLLSELPFMRKFQATHTYFRVTWDKSVYSLKVITYFAHKQGPFFYNSPDYLTGKEKKRQIQPKVYPAVGKR